MPTTHRRFGVLVASVVLLSAGISQAGGLYIQEFGTPAHATASAGAQATADDASTAFHNPAGMTRLDDHELMLAGGILIGDIQFDPDSDTQNTGGDGGQQGGPGPILGAHYAHKVFDRDSEWFDRVRFGFSLFSFSAAILDPDDDWAGRFEVQDLFLLTFTGMPSLAVRIHETFSLAVGANLTYGLLNYDVAVPLLGPNEGRIKFDDLNDFAAGATVSALWEPAAHTRVGLMWSQQVDLKLSGKIRNDRGADANLDTEIPYVQSVRASLVHELNPKLWLGASFRWEDWSQYEDQFVSISGFTSQIHRGWGDTYGGALGGRWQFADRWALLTGVGYDSSPVGASDRTADMPVDRQIRFSLGAQYGWSDDTTVGANFGYANLGPARIDSETLKGDYDRNQLFTIAFYVNWGKLPWSGKLSF
jgi:long-chain fatty acid transport protein